MKRIALISLIALIACSPKDDTKFYEFSNSDFDFLPTAYDEIGKIYTFRNQFGEEVQLEVVYYNVERESGGGMSFSQGYLGEFYYYQTLLIGVRFLNADIEGFPEGYCNTLRIKVSKTALGSLFYKVSIPSYENEYCTVNLFNFSSPFEDLIQFEVNDHIFGNVKIFQAARAPNFYQNSMINKVYFDLKQGVLGFDDISNNLEYRLIVD